METSRQCGRPPCKELHPDSARGAAHSGGTNEEAPQLSQAKCQPKPTCRPLIGSSPLTEIGLGLAGC